MCQYTAKHCSKPGAPLTIAVGGGGGGGGGALPLPMRYVRGVAIISHLVRGMNALSQSPVFLLIGKKFITMMSRLDGCTVSTVQCRIDVACTYSSPSGATGFQVIVQRQNQGDKLYVNQTDQTSASVMVEESGTYLVIVLAIVGAAGITDSATAAEYAETVNVDTQGLGKLPIIMLACGKLCT